MKPGREFDALFAERVMGLVIEKAADRTYYDPTRDRYDRPEHEDYFYNHNGELYRVPEFSTDMAAAWPIAEMFRMVIRPTVVNNWSAGVFKSRTFEPDGGSVQCVPGTWVEAETAPFAICLCALKAIEILA